MYPPVGGGSHAWVFSSSRRLDLQRLIVEIAAALLAAVILTLLGKWLRKVAPVRLSRRSVVLLLSLAGILAAAAGVRTTLRLNRPVPRQELARLSGIGTAGSGVFYAKIHNGSESWTVREVTIRLTLKKPNALKSLRPSGADLGKGWTLEDAHPREGKPTEIPEGFEIEDTSTDIQDYRIGGLWIPPLESRDVTVDILSPPGFEFDQWEVVSAEGFKRSW